MEQAQKEKAMSFKSFAGTVLFIVVAAALGLSGYLLYTLYGQNQNLQKEIAMQASRFSDFEQDLAKKGEKVQMQQVEMNKLAEENKKLVAENKNLEDETNKLNGDLNRMKEDFTGKLNALQKEKAAAEKKIAPLEQQIQKLKKELKLIKSQSPLPTT